MEYKKFCSLLETGENQTTDFKIECNALIKDNEKDKAELLKDIIAFSNNGNVASYLIIGVSDDRQGFKSVDNEKLTDDNIQVLVKENIFPCPKIKLTKCNWKQTTNDRHANKNFVIIQIGPQTRQCFRFIKDYINYEKKYCFKKNEVWIRRQAISDLASPEETKKLLEGKEPIEPPTLEANNNYERLPKNEFKDVLLKDLVKFASNINCIFSEHKDSYGRKWNILSTSINNRKYNIIVLIQNSCTGVGKISSICRSIEILHHGVLVLCTGNISKAAVRACPVGIKENWGYFCTNNYTVMHRFIVGLPTTSDEGQRKSMFDTETFCVAIDKIEDTQTLYSKLSKLFSSLNKTEDINKHLETVSEYINPGLTKWLESGCLKRTGKQLHDPNSKIIFNNTVKKVLKNEVVDIEKYGYEIFIKDEKMCEQIKSFLGYG